MNKVYIDNKSEFLHQLAELGFTPHDIIEAAVKANIVSPISIIIVAIIKTTPNVIIILGITDFEL